MVHNIHSYSIASNTVHSQLRNTNPVWGFFMAWFPSTRLTLLYVHCWAVILKIQWVGLWNVSEWKGRDDVLNPMIGISRIGFLFSVESMAMNIKFIDVLKYLLCIWRHQHAHSVRYIGFNHLLECSIQYTLKALFCRSFQLDDTDLLLITRCPWRYKRFAMRDLNIRHRGCKHLAVNRSFSDFSITLFLAKDRKPCNPRFPQGSLP